MALMKCPHCGVSISDIFEFCPSCGQVLRQTIKNDEEMESKTVDNTNLNLGTNEKDGIETNAETQVLDTPATNTEDITDNTKEIIDGKEKETNRKKYWFLLSGTSVLLIVSILIIIFLPKLLKTKEEGDPEGRTSGIQTSSGENSEIEKTLQQDKMIDINNSNELGINKDNLQQSFDKNDIIRNNDTAEDIDDNSDFIKENIHYNETDNENTTDAIKQINGEVAKCYDLTINNDPTTKFYGICCGGNVDKNKALAFGQSIVDEFNIDCVVLYTENWSNFEGNYTYIVIAGISMTEAEANNILPILKPYITDAFVCYTGMYVDYSDSIMPIDEDQKDDSFAYYDFTTGLSGDVPSFYGVWCAASKNKQEVDEIANKIVGLGFDGDVFYSENWKNLKGNNWFIVSAGVYFREAEANMVLSQIKKSYPGAYVMWSGDFIDAQQTLDGNSDELTRIEKMISYALENKLTEANLIGYTSFELSAIRNGIYAVHGYVFKNQKWNEFFSQYSWYIQNPSFNQDHLSNTENHNASLIGKYEESTYGSTYKFE